MGALLFLLCELVATGADTLPDDQAVTDVMCEWSKVKGAQVTPQVAADVNIHQGKFKVTVNKHIDASIVYVDSIY